MEEVVNTLNSAASSEEKTNFIIEYLKNPSEVKDEE